jgi:pyrroloquinoline quinone biosynthesis protein B
LLSLKLIGTAAGGGVPQWNCACSVCQLCRSNPQRVTPRLQTQAVFSSDARRWFLINASPDLRLQIEGNPELHPSPDRAASGGNRRGTPICGIVLTGADLDQVIGVLLLREFQPLTIYATPLVRRVLESNSFFQMLRRVRNQLTWADISPGVPFLLDGVTCLPIPLGGSLPYYAREFETGEAGQASLGLVLESDGRRVAYTPSLPEITQEWLDVYSSCDVILVDGTFWSDNELNRTHAATPNARDIGHLPISGDDGTIALLRTVTRPRKVFVHINNTNPILDRQSPEHAFVRNAGWEVASDGWRLT